jgi:hypothetical protein
VSLWIFIARTPPSNSSATSDVGTLITADVTGGTSMFAMTPH